MDKRIIPIGLGAALVVSLVLWSQSAPVAEFLPAYPGASEVQPPGMWDLAYSRVDWKAYDVSDPIPEVVSWYESEMSALGWGMVENQDDTDSVIVGWKMGDEGGAISITTKERQLIEEYAALFDGNILHTYRGDWDDINQLFFGGE